MPIPLFTIKLDCMPYDQLRLLDAWEAWEVPLEQQREWVIQLFGNQYVHDMEEFLSNQSLPTQKENHPTTATQNPETSSGDFPEATQHES